jgi:hypothetical protein
MSKKKLLISPSFTPLQYLFWQMFGICGRSNLLHLESNCAVHGMGFVTASLPCLGILKVAIQDQIRAATPINQLLAFVAGIGSVLESGVRGRLLDLMRGWKHENAPKTPTTFLSR